MSSRTRRTVRLLAASAVAGLGALVVPGTSRAAGWTELADLATCPYVDGPAVELQLTESVVEAEVLTVSCNATIDLNGFIVDVERVAIVAPAHLQIDDSRGGGRLLADDAIGDQPGIDVPSGAFLTIAGGEVTAIGGFGAAGIGGGPGDAGGTVTIAGGAVQANGGERGAGIGGGHGGAGGTTHVLGGIVEVTGSQDAAAIGSGDGGGHGGSTYVHDGTVYAWGGDDAAGIGGGDESTGGHIEVLGGTVHAFGGDNGAGIGGGTDGSGGDIILSGGTVHAYGGIRSAGIGGGRYGDGAAITEISGARVIAEAGTGAPAIGPGCAGSAGGPITIGATAEVDAVAAGASADCAASPALLLASGSDPSLAVDGALRLIGPVPVVLPDLGPTPTISVGTTGLISGPVDDPTGGPGFTGDGWIDNGGVIAFAATSVDVDVDGHNHLVTFQPGAGAAQPVRVFAPTFESGFRTMPSPASGTAWAVAGPSRWWSSDEALSGDLTLVEADLVATLTLTPSATTVDQGASVTFSVSAQDPFGAPVDPAGMVLTSSVGTDVVDGLTVRFPTASPHVITATLGRAATSVTIDVIPLAVDTTVPGAPAPPPPPSPPPPAPADSTVPPPAAPGELPATGAASWPIALVAVALLAIGSGVVAATRGRRSL